MGRNGISQLPILRMGGSLVRSMRRVPSVSEGGRPHLQTRVALSREISLPDLSTSQPQLEQPQPP